MWPVESQSDTLKYDVTALTYILSQGHARVGGSIVFRALWKQLSSKSEIGVRVRGGKTSKPLKSALHFTEQSSTLILLISIHFWKRINEIRVIHRNFFLDKFWVPDDLWEDTLVLCVQLDNNNRNSTALLYMLYAQRPQQCVPTVWHFR